MGIIFIISAQPSLPQLIPSQAQNLVTTLAHASEYGILATLLRRALRPERACTFTESMAVWTICLLYGISDEFHQSFVPGRDSSSVDVLADISGAAAALSFPVRRSSIH